MELVWDVYVKNRSITLEEVGHSYNDSGSVKGRQLLETESMYRYIYPTSLPSYITTAPNI